MFVCTLSKYEDALDKLTGGESRVLAAGCTGGDDGEDDKGDRRSSKAGLLASRKGEGLSASSVPTIESMLKPILGFDGTCTTGVGANGIIIVKTLHLQFTWYTYIYIYIFEMYIYILAWSRLARCVR